MDALTPVGSVSIEKFATLSAEIAASRSDSAKLSESLAKHEVKHDEWEQAVKGWATRLADPVMGAEVAPRFESLYHAVLDQLLGPPPDVPPSDVAVMWGEALAVGLPAMWQQRRLDALAWSRIAYHSRVAMAAEPGRLGAALAFSHLAAERRILGPLPTPGAPAQNAAEGSKGAASPPPVQRFDRDAETAAKAVGKAFLSGFDALGAAVDGFGKTLLRPNLGAAVVVTWSDGKKYPGTVAKLGEGNVYVTMADGTQHWIPDAYVKSI